MSDSGSVYYYLAQQDSVLPKDTLVSIFGLYFCFASQNISYSHLISQ